MTKSKEQKNDCFKSLNHLLYSKNIIRLTILIIFLCSIQQVNSLLCYSCVSTQPGCTLDSVNWLIHSAETCPNANDKCVKIIESHGVDVRVVRGCLSKLIPYRNDVPADHYEGCRQATKPGNRAIYTENHITELQLKQPYYDNITYCFCELDHWCNSQCSTNVQSSIFTILIISSTISSIYIATKVF